MSIEAARARFGGQGLAFALLAFLTLAPLRLRPGNRPDLETARGRTVR